MVKVKKIKLALGIHNHQPVGNFDFVFEEAYQKAYLPFLNLLARHPEIKVAQHFTGVLFEWLLNRDPEFGTRLRKTVTSGQVEMMSGGYYEPILVNIPDKDKLGQIKKLNDFVKENTGYVPRGLWLAERIWEPQLPKILAQTGAKYVVIDDSHFKAAGVEENDLFGYYVTEETGSAINIIPICERLRYTIPFQEPQVTIDYLRSIATEDGNKLAVFADDGEKFGLWPGTYKHCYEDKWLDRFFDLLEENSDWIEVIHFSEALEKILPVGRVYLPTASYREMMEWALPSKAIKRYEDFESRLKENSLFDEYKVFVRGGFWRNFLAKYSESNNLHKKSLWISNKIYKAIDENKYDEELLNKAKDHLWAGQTNCPYWHGIFGGLYLTNLRHAVYSNMIKAEAILDQATKINGEYENGWFNVSETDFDADGRKELIIESKYLNLYFAPHTGGKLFEMDYKPKSLNLTDTMTRRKEAYHQNLLEMQHKKESDNNSAPASIHDMVILKEPDLDKKLWYDWYNRAALIDHFLAPETTLEQMLSSDYVENGDFVLSPYLCEVENENCELNIKLYRNGVVKVNNNDRNIALFKSIRLFKNSPDIIIEYKIRNESTEPVDLWFAPELAYALLAGNAPDRYYYFDKEIEGEKNLGSIGSVNAVTQMGLKDEWMKVNIQLSFDQPSNIWRFPIETISQSEGGFERVYQSSVILPNWKIHLESNSEWTVEINQKIIDI